MRKKISQILQRFTLPADAKQSLRRMARHGRAFANTKAAPYVVVVDGTLGVEALSIYYAFLLLAVQDALQRPIKIVLLVQKRLHAYWRSNRVFKQLFDTSVVALDDRVQGEGTAVESQRLLSGLRGQQDILDLSMHGIHFGPNIYAGYLRKHFVGAMHPSGPGAREILEESLDNLALARRTLERFSPDLLLLSHSDYHSFGAFFKTFLHANVPALIGTLYGDGRVGGRLYACLSDFEDEPRNYAFACTPQTWQEAVQNYSAQDDAQVEAYLKKRFAGDDNSFNGDYHKSTTRLQKEALLQQLGATHPFKASALIAAHLLWDDATSSYRNVYCDYASWLRRTLEIAGNNPDVLWIVKAHPSELHMGTKDRVRDIVRDVFGNQLPSHIVFLDADTHLNTYSLIEAVDAVVTVRGTIGFEAACLGRTVINAGTGPYTAQGFNREFTRASDYEHCLATLHETDLALRPEQVRSARIAIFVYLINKGPTSALLFRVSSLAHLTASAEEPTQDAVLKRFASRIIDQKACDLL
jgi:hypothetical protein